MQWSLRGMAELIEHVHPAEIKPGMRMPAKVVDMKPSRELIPVWDVDYGDGRYTFRLSNGERRLAVNVDRVYAVREIRPEDRPPYTGPWITHTPFGFYDQTPGVSPDREWYQDSRQLARFTPEDGRVYRLLTTRRYDLFVVCRWDHGKKWLGPTRFYAENAWKQWEAIERGNAW